VTVHILDFARFIICVLKINDKMQSALFLSFYFIGQYMNKEKWFKQMLLICSVALMFGIVAFFYWLYYFIQHHN